MLIQVSAGTGTGPTKLAAFDAALNAAGVANYNLIRLSSIIPPDSKIIVADGPVKEQPGDWGDRLYVVMVDSRVDSPNIEAWAGIGWVQDKKTGRGLFVEHEGHSETTVRSDIEQSLAAMQATRNINYGKIQTIVVGKTCTGEPVCSLAIAVFQASDWKAQIKAKLSSLKPSG